MARESRWPPDSFLFEKPFAFPAKGFSLFIAGMIAAHLRRCGSPCIVLLMSPSHFSGLRAHIHGCAHVWASDASSGCGRVVWICGGSPAHSVCSIQTQTRWRGDVDRVEESGTQGTNQVRSVLAVFLIVRRRILPIHQHLRARAFLCCYLKRKERRT